MTDYANLRVTVMGLGRFGGGAGVTRFLARRGADVLVTDTLSPEDLRDSLAQLADLAPGNIPGCGEVTYRLGGHNVSDFTTADLVVVNPAVPPDNRFVRAARAAGVPLTSEIRLLVKHLPNRLRTIGVTGSAGKSTTTAMIGHILRKALGQYDPSPRRQDAKTPRTTPGVWVGGNIGGSLLVHLDEIQADDWIVLELSSFMLEGLREDKWSPHIAVVTNISPNHLDWHGSMEDYVRAKHTIAEFQKVEDRDALVTGLVGDEWFYFPAPRSANCRAPRPEWETAAELPLKIPGMHNQRNAQYAIAAVQFAFDWQDFIFTLAPQAVVDFVGLPHRLEFVGTVAHAGPRSVAVGFGGDVAGVRCYNDSKSTTPEAAMLAVESFPPAPGKVRIILGGYDKGSDFGALAKLAAERCAGVYTIGKTGDKIAGLVELECEQRAEARSAVRRCGTLEVAVAQALDDAKATGGTDQVLVLSPACASWDQFTNYEQRGARFVELVREAAGANPRPA